MTETLTVASGLAWIVAYVLMIRRGFADQAYAMPLTAAAANVAWEFIFSFVRPMDPPQLYINTTWLLLDAVILLQCFHYGRREWADSFSAGEFYSGYTGVLVSAAALVLLASAQFEHGPRYVAFSQNLMMSALFIALFVRRRGTRGQSLAIAIWKLIGTGCASAYCLLTGRQSPLLEALFLLILLLDAVYVALVQRAGGTPRAGV